MTKTMKQVSEVELAYNILQKMGKSMYFRELITEVLELTGRRIHSLSHAIAEVHTQINMDSRFVHMGKGMWGLMEWSPQQLNAARLASEKEDSVKQSSTVRRQKLFEEIQQEYVAANAEAGERE